MTVTESSIYETLCSIQTELVAPKGQYNSFGKYKYRSAEDILEALKPLLKKHGACLILSDDIVQVGERYYACATATLFACGSSISVQALAREEDTKKGMDGSQITGTASSYARKYALNGLFAIDDNKDPDTDEYAKQNKKQKQEKMANTQSNHQAQRQQQQKAYLTEGQQEDIKKKVEEWARVGHGTVEPALNWVLNKFSVEGLEQLLQSQYDDVMDLLDEVIAMKQRETETKTA